MTDPSPLGRGNLASAKFNFLAWAARNRADRKLSAADLMVLVQLAVRFDPERGPFAMSSVTLAHRTGLGESTVRGAIDHLEHLRYIEVIPKPGRSSAYRVRFGLAPPKWIKKARDDYEAKRTKAAPVAEPSGATTAAPPANPAKIQAPSSNKAQPPHPAKSLAPHPAKFGAHTPLRSEHPPLQKPSGVSISSKNRSSNSFSSMRADARKSEIASASEEKKKVAVTLAQPEPTSSLPKRDAVTSLEDVSRLPAPAAPKAATADAFEAFLKIWPRADADEAKLRAAWHNRVVKAGVDPNLVLKAARAWRRQRSLDAGSFVPPAGQWLAEEGWRNNVPDVNKRDRKMNEFFNAMARRSPPNIR